MVLLTPLASVHRKFDGKRFTLEEASRTKSVTIKRKKQMMGHGYKVRVIKNSAGYYLLYYRKR